MISKEWLEENKEIISGIGPRGAVSNGEYVKLSKLQDNLNSAVDTQYSEEKKEVVNIIPYVVGEYIEKQKLDGYSLQQTFYQIHSAYKNNDMAEEHEWASSNEHLFALAWIEGWETKEELYTFNIELNKQISFTANDEDEAWRLAEEQTSELLNDIEVNLGLDFEAEWTME